jgi:hypothetical protein
VQKDHNVDKAEDSNPENYIPKSSGGQIYNGTDPRHRAAGIHHGEILPPSKHNRSKKNDYILMGVGGGAALLVCIGIFSIAAYVLKRKKVSSSTAFDDSDD